MLIEVRRAMAEDISRVLKFYAERRYGGGIRPEDAMLLAEHEGELIGIVRLTPEEGVVVLRGMQVHPRFQRQGIGKRLLAAVAQELDGKRLLLHPVRASRRFLWRNRIPRDGTREGTHLSQAAAEEISRPRRWERLSHHAPRRYPGSF